jgi:deoxyadenosine/deoxycytidine kinase
MLSNCNAFFRINLKLNSRPLSNSFQRSFSTADDKFTPILISIEGNIGAGKSTLLDYLRKSHPEWKFIREPVDTWSEIRNESGESLLQVFYKDRKRWSYTFQNCALLTRFQNIEATISDAKKDNSTGRQVFLTERCLETDYQVFTKMLREEGSIDGLEFDLYKRWLSHLRSTATPLSGIVHVNTTPEICAERIKKRSREGEDEIGLEYLNNLESYQSKWLDSLPVPSISTDLVDLERVERFIKDFAQ